MPTSTMPSQFPGLGANIHNGSCSFRLWAPNAREVSLIGDFNSWKRDDLWLFHEGNGYWSIDVQGPSAGQEYKFKIVNRPDGADNPGGAEERTDPCSYDVPSSETN
jgi:1,4-alpha-glucan branching enzyme